MAAPLRRTARTAARHRRIAALGLTVAALTAACGGSDSGSSQQPAGTADSSKPVTLTWWHNGTQEPGTSYYQAMADAYTKKNPNVTFKITPTQSEQLRKKIPVALQGGDAPDLFMQWGGGELLEQVRAGKVQDITAPTKELTAQIGGSAANWQVEGKQYGLPYSMGLVGFWYSKSAFEKAGIGTPPATQQELLDAVQKLKDAGIAPIAVGAKDKWPVAFYWDWYVVRMCSQEVLQKAATEFTFEDPCWVRAGEENKKLIDAKPFNEGFLGTTAQQGAGSSAGLLANGKAAMELMGQWNPGVMEGLTSKKERLKTDLGWFPFPSVDGGAGAPDAQLGGGDGWSCSKDAPPQCADFITFMLNVENQTELGAKNIGLPVTPGAEAGVADENLKKLLEIRNQSTFVQVYLDVTFGASVGGALNEAATALLAGQTDPQGVVKAVADAAASAG